MTFQSFPTIIIGGGLAGISCAIELKHNGLDHLLLDERDKLGGQLSLIRTKIRNLGGLYFTDGASLQRQANENVLAHGIRFKSNARVLACDLYEKTVETEAGLYRADSLVLATGARLRLLEADYDPGLKEQVVYFTERREADFAGRNVLLIGGGDYALVTTLDLSKAGADVTLLNRGNRLRARPDLLDLTKTRPNVRILTNKRVVAVRGDRMIQSVEIEDAVGGERTKLAADAIVAKIGCAPNSELFAGQLALTEDAYIPVDANLETTIPGIFAIGDLNAFKYMRLATALGQGAAAALSVMHYLEKGDREAGKTGETGG